MPIFRPATALNALTRRASPLSCQRLSIRTLTSSSPRYAQPGYGDMDGNPIAKDPQNQGASNATKHNAEHPGPAPPAEGKGSGAGPTKGGDTPSPSNSSGNSKNSNSTSKSHSGKTPEDASAQSGGARSKEVEETGSSPTAGKIVEQGEKSSQQKGEDDSSKNTQKKGKGSPKILDQAKPMVDSEGKREKVERHNKQFEKGHDH
ncbi:hypothetical protein HYALB_00001755 [Hymenoscyphus albidus]|uniref:Uncharacterized protein n=1 Tax=Hymenoscyphus albidus TaxID=595503 RepID=A0A9N9PWX3_9HELO|nr:hypothetical protein HYALB_00001755 [Hymenoscyphus albidus]